MAPSLAVWPALWPTCFRRRPATVEDKVVIVNAEKAIVTGSPASIMATYHAKYELNHARKGPYFPRMPDMILKRTVRGMLPTRRSPAAAVPSATCVWKSAARPTWTATCPKATPPVTAPLLSAPSRPLHEPRGHQRRPRCPCAPLGR